MSRRSTTTARMPDHERSGRSLVVRALPFVPPWALAAAVPAAGMVTHQTWGNSPVTTPIATLALAGAGAGLTALTWAISKKAAREAIIRWHSTITIAAATGAITGTMIAGLPRPWLDVVLGTGAVFAGSWNLRRFDALRSDTTERTEADSWGQVLGMPKTKPGKPLAVGARIEVPLHHGPGETVRNAQQALPAIESARGIPAGRSRVVADVDNAGKSTLVLVEHDVLKHTIPWAGPSAPGGSITDPLNAGVYEDDQLVLLWLPASPPGAKVSRPPTNLMYMGITRSGKTQTGLINTAEILTRRDVVVIWADGTKGEQTAGPIRSGLTLYANTVRKTRVLFKGLKAMVKARADLLGKYGFRDWRPECYDHPQLRMPFCVIHLEEADEYIGTDEFTWLTGKALSTGCAISVSLQRADHASMPTTARYNIGAALCFGTGDDYSAQFALSEATIAAGAHPENWKASRQGYFYLESPGVDADRYPVPARGFYATDDQIAAVVDAHAHLRATLDAASIAALGEAWHLCQPTDADTPPAGAPATTAAAGRPSPRPKRETMPTEDDDRDALLAEEVAAELAELREQAAREVAEEFPEFEPAEGEPALPRTSAASPLPAYNGPDLPFADARPDAANQEQAEQAFDDVVRALADEGKNTVSVADILARYPYRSRTWLSRRLSAVAEGAIVAPPGIGVERGEKDGTYTLHHLADAH
ncbi:MAG: hypothetical protein HOV83_07200 [Catenulispora sp.]|nr:hypothetical protein [Catenulispora sp.]